MWLVEKKIWDQKKTEKRRLKIKLVTEKNGGALQKKSEDGLESNSDGRMIYF
jgi:hypothetical protein